MDDSTLIQLDEFAATALIIVRRAARKINRRLGTNIKLNIRDASQPEQSLDSLDFELFQHRFGLAAWFLGKTYPIMRLCVVPGALRVKDLENFQAEIWSCQGKFLGQVDLLTFEKEKLREKLLDRLHTKIIELVNQGEIPALRKFRHQAPLIVAAYD